MDFSDYSDTESEYDNDIITNNNNNTSSSLTSTSTLETIKEITIPSIDIYLGRIKRRNELIKEMRSAYLRDIILMKELLKELLTNDERIEIFKQYEKNLPSLDLHHFMLQHPPENSFELIPCNLCGGTVEIVHHDSSEIKKLTLQLESMDQKKSDFRLIIATKTAQLDTLEEKLKITERKYREEKNVLFQEIRDLKSSNESMRIINEKLENSKNVLSSQITELKALCSQTTFYQDQYRQINIEMERVLSEIRAVEESRKADKEQIKTLTEKNSYLNERKEFFEKMSSDLTNELNKSKEVQLHQQQIAETAQKLSIKLQGTIDNQIVIIENLRADKTDLSIELETLKEESVIHIQEIDRQNEKLLEEKEGLERSLFELRQQLQTTKSDKELLESEFNELYMTYSAYRQECEPKMNHIEKLYNDSQMKITELVCENEELGKKDKESQKIINNSQKTIQELEIQTKTLQDMIKELEKKIIEYEDRLKHEEKEKNEVKRDYSSLKDRSREREKDKDKIYRQPRPLPTRSTPSSSENKITKPLELKNISSISLATSNNTSNNILENDTKNNSHSPIHLNNITSTSTTPTSTSTINTTTNIKTNSNLESESESESDNNLNAQLESSSRLQLPRLNNQSPKFQDSSIDKSSSVDRLSPQQKLEKLKLKTSSKVIADDKNNEIQFDVNTIDKDSNTIIVNPSLSSENEKIQSLNSPKATNLPKKIELRKPELKSLKLNSISGSSSSSSSSSSVNFIQNNDNKIINDDNISYDNMNPSDMISPSSKKSTNSPHLSKGPSKRFEFFDSPSSSLSSRSLKSKSGSKKSKSVEKKSVNENIELNNDNNDNNNDFEVKTDNDQDEKKKEDDNVEDNNDDNNEDEDDEDDEAEDNFQDDLSEMQQQIMGKLGPKGFSAKRHTILSSMSTDEFSEETANTTNMMNEAIAEILRDGGMNEKYVRLICRTITPVLTAIAQIISKSTIAVLRSVHMLQQCLNVFCKVNTFHSAIKPKLSIHDESIRSQIIEAQNLIRNYDSIDKQKTSWITESSYETPYQIDLELMELFKDSKDLTSNQRTISMSAYASLMKRYFGYQLDTRPVKLDKVLDTIFHMKAYTDNILEEVDKTSYHIDTNWFEMKLSSLDCLLLAPEAKRAKELKERNQNLAENLSTYKAKFTALENEHSYLMNKHQTLENNYSVVFEQNTERSMKIEELSKNLEVEITEHKIASVSLAKAIEAERARINDLETKECQTDPNTIDNFTQTEFIVPPISLRHRLAISDRPLTVSSTSNSPTKRNSNHVFYPMVTPGGNSAFDIESSLSHSLNEIKSQASIPYNSNSVNSYTQYDDDNISILSNDSSSFGSMSTYDTNSTWNSEYILSQYSRPSSQLQLNRALPNVQSKTPSKKKRNKLITEEFPSISNFLSSSQSLPASPLKRNIIKR